MKRSLTSLTLVILLSFLTLAQQPAITSDQKTSQQPTRPTDDDVVRITTNLVQVDAVVTDKNGKPVTDLRPEEVEIYEDGKPQKITHFSFVSLATPENSSTEAITKADKNASPMPPVLLRREQVRRTIALVVDDLGLSFESAYYVRHALKKFVDEQVQPGDLVAIIRTASGVGALQQFTSDKRLLYAAVERVKWNPTGRGGIAAFAPIGTDSGGRFRDSDSAGQDSEEFREEIFAVGTLGAINYVIRGMKELPGRKSILLFSDGIRIFNRSDPAGSNRILMALRALTDRANRASVVIYAMDARGLATLGLTAADSVSSSDQIEQLLNTRRNDYFESQNGLNYLAQQTGGFFIHDTNDLGKGIQRVIEDQKSYYLIGYRPQESTFDQVSGRRTFHKLGLKVLRAGKFNVRIRNGFYGMSDEEVQPTTGTPRQRIYDALMSPFGASEVHLRLTSFFSNEAQVGSIMRSMLHVKAADLSFSKDPDGSHRATFDVIVVAFGDNGMVVDQVARTHTIRVKDSSYERILREGFVYNVTMPIRKAGAYQLRTALRDRTSERVGSASQFVEVPDVKKNRLTTSGIVVRGMSLSAYTRLFSGSPQPANQDDTVEDETTAAASPALREFHRGMALVYGFTIYNSQMDKVTGKPSLQIQTRLFRNGQQLFSGKPMPLLVTDQKDPKRRPVSGAIQLGTDMQPGEYVIQVLVTDLLAKEKYRVASPWMSFEIVD